MNSSVHYNYFISDNSCHLAVQKCCFSTSRLRHDYYTDLGLEQSADGKSIKEAYYMLSKLHHPDVNGDSPESHRKFQVFALNINAN